MKQEKQDKKLIIYDTTLRDGEQAPGFKMNGQQKLEIARYLEKLNVDIIEAGFPASSRGDFSSVFRIAEQIRTPTISALARCVDEDIIRAGEALAPAIERNKGKIHVFIATSNIHAEKKLRKTKREIIEKAVKGVNLARRYTSLVEFSCEDFGRSESDYTAEIIRAVVDAGANTINLPDTVGYRFPSEIEEMVRSTIEKVGKRGIDGIIYSMHAHNDLGLATANTIYAIRGGVRQVEVTMNGIGERAGNAALEEVVAAIVERPEFFDNIRTDVNAKMIIPASQALSRLVGKHPQVNKAIVGENAFSHSSGIHADGVIKDKKTYEWISPERYGGESKMVLTARSGTNLLEQTLKEKGIAYNPRQIKKIAERFKNIADRSSKVYDDALVMAVRGDTEVPKYYNMVQFEAWIDHEGKGNARVYMRIDEDPRSAIRKGNGMIHATELCMNQLTKTGMNIVEYISRSESKGAESKGIESVVVENNGFKVKGFGLAEDTVMGAAYALVDASNKMRYVLENKKRK